MEKLEANIRYAWDRFYLDTMRASKAGIFSKAEEITRMRQIRDSLLNQLPNLDQEQINRLLFCDNVLEDVYRYVLDYAKPRKSIDSLISDYLGN